ncbi:hypothetical protein CCHR01_18753 [Colletotrichum chrysophilum]|uniref:Uncharacterized protein n=1 Tax=Colletotrichum chrysophilum TaxID=1836956 RepID=A0AAD8ZZI5_9PEZI|nr:hypothetical protein CCHR01_18753 [Colletotrichum chrysophilum]
MVPSNTIGGQTRDMDTARIVCAFNPLLVVVDIVMFPSVRRKIV